MKLTLAALRAHATRNDAWAKEAVTDEKRRMFEVKANEFRARIASLTGTLPGLGGVIGQDKPKASAKAKEPEPEPKTVTADDPEPTAKWSADPEPEPEPEPVAADAPIKGKRTRITPKKANGHATAA
jgi:hypothetical protein